MNATTATGDTPLSFACENGHTDVADILLEVGAELVRMRLIFAQSQTNFHPIFPQEK